MYPTSFPGNKREHFESKLTLRIGAVQETCGEIWNGAPEMCHEGKCGLGNVTKRWQGAEEAPGAAPSSDVSRE